jgi:hypothetical protein
VPPAQVSLQVPGAADLLGGGAGARAWPGALDAAAAPGAERAADAAAPTPAPEEGDGAESGPLQDERTFRGSGDPVFDLSTLVLRLPGVLPVSRRGPHPLHRHLPPPGAGMLFAAPGIGAAPEASSAASPRGAAGLADAAAAALRACEGARAALGASLPAAGAARPAAVGAPAAPDRLAPPRGAERGVRKMGVTVHAAASLPKVDLVGSIDPYFTLRLGGAEQRTKTVRNAPDPAFEEVFELPLPEGDDAAAGALVVTLWDWQVRPPSPLLPFPLRTDPRKRFRLGAILASAFA